MTDRQAKYHGLRYVRAWAFLNGVDRVGCVLKIQGQDGNWNHSPYQLGVYNGLAMAYSFTMECEPPFRERPGRFLEEPPIVVRT